MASISSASKGNEKTQCIGATFGILYVGIGGQEHIQYPTQATSDILKDLMHILFLSVLDLIHEGTTRLNTEVHHL